MFSHTLISKYGAGDCHLLSLYIHRLLSGSQIYKLVSKTKVRRGKLIDIIVHSLIYYEGFFYDIHGKYESVDHIIKHWVAIYDEDYNSFWVDKSEEVELPLEQYTEQEHNEAYIFVKNNLLILLSQPPVSLNFD